MSESGYSSDEFDSEYFYKREMNSFKLKYKIISLLINSANGTLYNGLCRRTGNEIIIKKIEKKKKNLIWSAMFDRKIPSEIKYHLIACSVTDQTVGLMEYFEQKNTFLMILEKPENSIDLLEFINQFGPLDYNPAISIAKKIAYSCLKYHSAGMSHRDIKTENILFNPNNGNIKIIDFGSASKYDSLIPSGTSDYFPPEAKVKTGNLDIESVTVYSIGCLLYTLLTGKSPFSKNENFDFTKNIILNYSLSKVERNLLFLLLNPDPVMRPSLYNITQL